MGAVGVCYRVSGGVLADIPDADAARRWLTDGQPCGPECRGDHIVVHRNTNTRPRKRTSAGDLNPFAEQPVVLSGIVVVGQPPAAPRKGSFAHWRPREVGRPFPLRPLPARRSRSLSRSRSDRSSTPTEN